MPWILINHEKQIINSVFTIFSIHRIIIQEIFHYCFAKCVLSKPLDYCDLFCIRINSDYRLCEICSNNCEITIIAQVKKVVIIAIITSNRMRYCILRKIENAILYQPYTKQSHYGLVWTFCFPPNTGFLFPKTIAGQKIVKTLKH